MDLQENAHPALGTSVADAAQAIGDLGFLNEPASPDDAAAEKAEPEADRREGESVPEHLAEGEGEEPESKPEEQDQQAAEAEAADGEELELPDSLDGLAEAIGLEPLDLQALKVNVKVNGETKAVTLADAVKGYQLEADYRQKTSDLAEQRRAHEKAVSDAQQEWQRRFEAVDALAQQLKTVVEGETPDLEKILREEGPEAYWAAKAEHEVKANALKAAEDARRKAQEENQARSQQDAQSWFAEQQRRVRELIPDFYDEKKGPELKSQMQTYLAEKGFSPEDVKGVADARIMDVVYDAMRYRSLQKSKPEVTKKLKVLPKVTKPGAATDKGDATRNRQVAKVQKLRKSGHWRDAAGVFGEML